MSANAPFRTADRLALFPDSTRIRSDALTVAGQELAALAGQYGTPLYVYDGLSMDAAVAAYRGSLKAHYPAPAEITYAGKAFLCTAIAQWAHRRHLWVDCTGEGEIGIALAGGVARGQILVHGVNKSLADLKSAIQHAGTIVVDNLTELNRIKELFSTAGQFPSLWLRLQPGLAVTTHHSHTQTGQAESKFGMTPQEIVEAVQLCRQSGLPLGGVHFHQGSQFREPAPLLPAIDLGLDLAQETGFNGDWDFCPGGGWGVAYHEDELPQPEIDDYVRLVAESVVRGCRKRGLPLPRLHLEPGRSLVARAGLAVYRVEAVKRRDQRTWLLIDGGIADNPRHSLYGAKYSCLPVHQPERPASEAVWIAGPYCESGDVIIENLPMPAIEEGELIAVPVSGAYHLSMASNYNGARRPAVVLLEEGGPRLIVRRETVEELTRRDLAE